MALRGSLPDEAELGIQAECVAAGDVRVGVTIRGERVGQQAQFRRGWGLASFHGNTAGLHPTSALLYMVEMCSPKPVSVAIIRLVHWAAG